MAWVEFHAARIKRLQKFHNFRTEMQWSVLEALGFLGSFWGEAIEVAEDGVFTNCSPNYLSELTGVDATIASRAWEAMMTHKWLERLPCGKVVIHDWLDCAGLYLTRKYASHNPKKLREIWLIHGRKYGGKQHANTNCLPRNTKSKPTVPYHTVPIKELNTGGGKPVENSAALQRFTQHFTHALKTKTGATDLTQIKKAQGVVYAYLKEFPQEWEALTREVDALPAGWPPERYVAQVRAMVGARTHERVKQLAEEVGKPA